MLNIRVLVDSVPAAVAKHEPLFFFCPPADGDVVALGFWFVWQTTAAVAAHYGGVAYGAHSAGVSF